MKRAKKTILEIADTLGRHRSTIYRELERNTGGRGYRPQQAQQLADERHEACRQPTKMSHPELKTRSKQLSQFGDEVIEELIA